MPKPGLDALEARRAELYAARAATGDFRRGLTEDLPALREAALRVHGSSSPGHGPRHLLTRSVAGKTVTHQLVEDLELEKVRREVAAWAELRELVRQVSEVNEAIGEARPVSPLATGEASSATGTGVK